jgi:rare lipoprotein A
LLRVNDRGPYIGRRVIDVSWAAAKRLGFVYAGITQVRIEVVSFPKSSLSPSIGQNQLLIRPLGAS